MQEGLCQNQALSPRSAEPQEDLSTNCFSQRNARSHFDFLSKLDSLGRLATTDERAQRSLSVNQALSALTNSITDLFAGRRTRAKEVYKEVCKQFQTEVLPGLTSDIWPADSRPAAQKLHEVLKSAIRDDLVKTFLRGNGAAVFTLLEYIDRQRLIESSYPGFENLLGDLKARGYLIDPDVERALKAASFEERIERLAKKVCSSPFGHHQLSSALLSLTAVAKEFRPEIIEDTLLSIKPPSRSRGLALRPKGVRRVSSDFSADLLSELQEALSEKDFGAARDFIRSRHFLYAARLNASCCKRIIDHVKAFCRAAETPYGETPESIGREVVHSLCEDFKRFRDEFITWKFPFSTGAEDAIRCFDADLTSERDKRWLSYIFRGGFTPPDPDRERLDLCLKEPRLFVLGAMLRRDCSVSFPLVRDLAQAKSEYEYLFMDGLEPLTLFIKGHAAALIKSESPECWVSLNITDFWSFGLFVFSQRFAKYLVNYLESLAGATSVENGVDLRIILKESLASTVAEQIKYFPKERTRRQASSSAPGTEEGSWTVERWDKFAQFGQEFLAKGFQRFDDYPRILDAGRVCSELARAGYSSHEVQTFLQITDLKMRVQTFSLIMGIDGWKAIKEKPFLRPPPDYLIETAQLCPYREIRLLNAFLWTCPTSVWEKRIAAKDLMKLFEDSKLCRPQPVDQARLLTFLVNLQQQSSLPLLGDKTEANNALGGKNLLSVDSFDNIDPQRLDPLFFYLLSEEIELRRFQPGSNLPQVATLSYTYLAANISWQRPHRKHPIKSVQIKKGCFWFNPFELKCQTESFYTSELLPATYPEASRAHQILKGHKLLFNFADRFANGGAHTFRHHEECALNSATAIDSPLCQFFLACLRSPFEKGGLRAIFSDFTSASEWGVAGRPLEPKKLARYVELLVDALDGGFHDNIDLTRRNKPLAKVLAKELELNVLIEELRRAYNATLTTKLGSEHIDVTFTPTIGWLMEVSGAISGSCVGKLTKIAETYTEGVFVPFVVQGDPPHFSGGSFVFEGVLANGEKVMVIRGFNPRTFLLSNVRAGDLFEAFADYVAEMGQACGASRVVLPHADFWHNPATLRPNVHFYFQDTYMSGRRLKLGECQVRNFNNFSVNYVVEVRKISPLTKADSSRMSVLRIFQEASSYLRRSLPTESS